MRGMFALLVLVSACKPNKDPLRDDEIAISARLSEVSADSGAFTSASLTILEGSEFPTGAVVAQSGACTLYASAPDVASIDLGLATFTTPSAGIGLVYDEGESVYGLRSESSPEDAFLAEDVVVFSLLELEAWTKHTAMQAYAPTLPASIEVQDEFVVGDDFDATWGPTDADFVELRYQTYDSSGSAGHYVLCTGDDNGWLWIPADLTAQLPSDATRGEVTFSSVTTMGDPDPEDTVTIDISVAAAATFPDVDPVF